MDLHTAIEQINHEMPNEESSTLELDPKHPGINDQTYIKRRQEFFDLCRKHRLQQLGIPPIEYTADEHAIWTHVCHALRDSHEAKACSIYLHGKHLLNIDGEHIPDLQAVNMQLRQQNGIQLAPAEGLIDTRNFFEYLSNRTMPCTQYLRHHAKPEYTPEPDMVHDLIGHVPQLVDKDYVELIQLIGGGVKHADDHQLVAWQRIYWFTIEYGLIQEEDETKVFGAGILSSSGEMQYCFSDNVDRRPFNLADVITQDFDTTVMQDILFVIPSIKQLYHEIETLIEGFKQFNS